MCNSEFVQNMQRRNRCIIMFIEMRLVWLWVMLLVLASECYGCLEHERVALLQLKAYSNKHRNVLPTWVEAWEGETTTDCCKWERVKCNATTGRVIQLSLNSVENYLWNSRDWYLNASMFLPFEELESLDLSYNRLAGWLEDEGFEKLGELTSLKSLNLSYNYLEGTIHINDLKSLNNLEQLDISYNHFDGFITHSGFERLSVLGKLELLILNGNSFNNSILSSLGVLSSLKTLSLFGNRLNESIDIGEFCNMNLKELDLRANSIEDIKGFERLSVLGKLELLRLDWNSFTNSILPSLGVLSSLKTLSLFGNRLNGSIDIGDKAHLKYNYNYPNLGVLRAALRVKERSWAKLLKFEPTYRYSGRRKAKVSDFLLEEAPEPDPSLPEINLIPLTAEQEMAKKNRLKAMLTATARAEVPQTGQTTEAVVALPSQRPSSSRRNKRARTSQTETRLVDEDETVLPPSPPPSPQQNLQPEQADLTATSSKWAPVLSFNDRDISAADSVVAEKDHLMAFNLAKSVCLPKDMEHHYKQLNTELKSIRSSTKSMILAIQKNTLAHRQVVELRKTTRQAMAEVEARRAELEEARRQLAELRSENGRLTEIASSVEAEKQKVAHEAKDKYLRLLARIEKQKDAQLKTEVKEAEKRGFKEAEDAYTLQCDAAKDLFFKCGWRSAVEKLGCQPDSEDYDAPLYFIPASLSKYAADLQQQFLGSDDEDDDEDEDGQPTDTPVVDMQSDEQIVRLELPVEDRFEAGLHAETELPHQTVLPSATGLPENVDADFDAEIDDLFR